MKKRLLLLAFLSMFIIASNAQLKRSETAQAPTRPQTQLFKPLAQMKEMQMRTPGTPVVKKAPKRTNDVDVWYRRPAGAFAASCVVSDGAYAGMYYAPYIAVRPYVDYTFNGYVDGVTEATYEWKVQYYGNNAVGQEEQLWETVPGMDLTVQYGYETDSVPIFKAMNPYGNTYTWNIRGYEMSGTSANPITGAEHSASILSVPSTMDIWDIDILKSSKSFCYGGRNGDNRYPLTYYSGAVPYGRNDNGWWFGKNGGTSQGNRIDGIAQAFEKPTAPYLLKQVVVDCAVLEVKAPVDMYCRIYKLDEIPPYIDDDEAVLPEEPGELIAMGRASLTPETADDTGDLIFFTLYGEEDGLEHDITLAIDCAILVVIDGYNNPEMENLIDFSALISSDYMVDEGFGELAYIKFGYPNAEGTVEQYVWKGLNNFFYCNNEDPYIQTLKTGLSIFLSTENPYLIFNYNAEDGEYLFPNEGGLMEKHFDNYTTRSIEFWSWTPSANDAWYVSCNDEEVPNWLSIELTDQMQNGEFTGLVNAEVVAEPLPEGVTFRKAIVRFGFPGAYIDYKFMQGNIEDDIPLDTTFYDFVVDGIYYSIIQPNEVCVTYRDEKFNTYSGDIVIPNEVTYRNTTYIVTAIGEYAFKGCYSLNSLTIPVEITSIANNAFKGCNLKNVCITGNGAWNNANLPNTVKTLFVGSGVTAIEGLKIKPTTIYSYSPVPPICNDITFTGYEGALHVPEASLASYFIAPYWCNFANIIGDAVEPLNVSINKDSIELLIGNQSQLTTTISPVNATPSTISWYSSNNNVANVVNGKITAIAAGECDITATCVGRQDICHVTVNEIAPTSIILNQYDAVIEVENQIELTATVLPDSATFNTVTWSSSDETIAVVNNGIVTAIKAGECNIIASCRNLTSICHITVVNHINVISLDVQEAYLLPNHIITLTPNASPVMPEGFTVSSSNPMIAAARVVNDKVQVVGIKEGTTVITVGSTDGNAIPDSCIVTVYTERGDVNCDGFVNISDVTALIDVLLGGDVNHSEENADCNNDGKMTISDVTALIDALLGGAPLPEKNYEVITVNGVTFKMIKVQGGTFTMGATPDHGTEDPWNDEWPTHEVTVSSFSIGQTEVTQELWQAVMGSNPSYFTSDANRPVETVSWDECQQFIATLNQLTGMNFRMPTEAEWEYAARGGNMTEGYKYAGSNDINEIAWWDDNACDGVGESSPDYGTHPVALKKANELGLYDMSGNVWEWCQDWYGPYSEEAQINPTGPETGTEHLHRGGSWINYARNCRVSCRFHWVPDNANYVGLRLVK